MTCLGLADTTQTRLGRPNASYVPRDYSFVRMDTDKGQVYVAIDSALINNEDSLKAIISLVSNEAMRGKWSRTTLFLHLFTKSESARMKMEGSIKDRKTWKHNYLAHFDAWKKEIVLYPEIPNKRKKLRFDMCLEPEVSFFHKVHCGKKKPWEK